MTPRSIAGDGRPPTGPGSRDRAISAVVGVVALVGTTLVLVSACGALLAVDSPAPAPTARIEGSLSATDGWPEGQRLRLTHGGGDTLAADELAFVVELPRADASARLHGFPTRRLTGENVDGTRIFDNGYAGVDGAVDAAHTDGTWAAGETVEFRIAQEEFDVRTGDTARVRVIHRPSNGVLARLSLTAE